MKWSFVPKESAKPKYILVNGDESEPGTCKDRPILEHDPHSVIEGVIIAGLAVGAKIGFVYIRGEYRYLVDIMRRAIDDAYAKGYLGKNIFGSGKDFDVRWHTGAGAYEVGEESALMESLEGRAMGRSNRHQQRGDTGLRTAHHSDGRTEVCRLRSAQKRRHTAVLPQRPHQQTRRVRTSARLPTQKDDL
jgi:NADH:ubiquinone oxidoreductase subunit F (NADH-binding)